MQIIPKRIIDEIYLLEEKVNFLEANTKTLEKKLEQANKEVERLLNLRYPTSNKIDCNFEKL